MAAHAEENGTAKADEQLEETDGAFFCAIALAGKPPRHYHRCAAFKGGESLDFIVIVLILIGIVNAFAKNARTPKSGQNKQGKAGTGVDWQRMLGNLGVPEEVFSGNSHKEASTAKPTMPAAKPIAEEWQPLSREPLCTTAMSQEDTRIGKPLEWGSLGGYSSEGTDLCDASLGHHREPAQEALPLYVQGIGMEDEAGFSVSAQELVRGVVMSEILTRPSDRKWGRR